MHSLVLLVAQITCTRDTCRSGPCNLRSHGVGIYAFKFTEQCRPMKACGMLFHQSMYNSLHVATRVRRIWTFTSCRTRIFSSRRMRQYANTYRCAKTCEWTPSPLWWVSRLNYGVMSGFFVLFFWLLYTKKMFSVALLSKRYMYWR